MSLPIRIRCEHARLVGFFLWCGALAAAVSAPARAQEPSPLKIGTGRVVDERGVPVPEYVEQPAPATNQGVPAGEARQDIQIVSRIDEPAKLAFQKETILSLINAYASRGPLRDDPKKYPELKKQLVSDLRAALKQARSNQVELNAVVMLITELADKEYNKITDKLINDEVEKLSRSLAPDLIPLARDKNWKYRYVALRTLGKITPEPSEELFEAIKASLQKVEKDAEGQPIPASRRVAAYTLVDLARYAHLLPPKLVGDPIPLEQMKTIWMATELATLGLRDQDDLVKGYSMLAVAESARSFNLQVLPQQKAITELPAKKTELPSGGLDVTKKEYQEELPKIFAKYASVNRLLLTALQDRNDKIQLTALEAIESILGARNNFLVFVQIHPGVDKDLKDQVTRIYRFKDDPRKEFLKIVEIEEVADKTTKVISVPDPLRGVIEDRGVSIVRLLDAEAPDSSGETTARDVKLSRKAMSLLELLAKDLRLFEPGSKRIVLGKISQILRSDNEDVFVRWSAASILEKLLRSEASNGKSKQALDEVLALDLDLSLCKLLTDRRSIAYADPDLGKTAADALESLGQLASESAGSEKARRRIGAQFTSVVNDVFLMEQGGRIFYDIGLRYDVETRKAVLKTLVSVGGNYVAEALPTVTEALEKDPDPRLRRAAAEALGKTAAAAERAVPNLLLRLQAVLRNDDDAEVRMNTSEAILNITRARKSKIGL